MFDVAALLPSWIDCGRPIDVSARLLGPLLGWWFARSIHYLAVWLVRMIDICRFTDDFDTK